MTSFKAWWRRVRPGILAPIIVTVVHAINRSLKIQTPGFERYQEANFPIIYSGWHGRSFIAPSFWKGLGHFALISLSRDGEMQHRIFTRFGFGTVRGSTGRGGVKALIECIRLLKKERAKFVFTPDGPRGPSGEVQEGIVMMAQKSGAVVVPVGVAAARCWIAPTWDRYMVPKPFSRAVMMFGDPMTLDSKATPEEAEAWRLQLQAEMHRIQAEAERLMAPR